MGGGVEQQYKGYQRLHFGGTQAMIKAYDFVQSAYAPGLVGTPYEKLDCQALVEKMLALCGVKQNWRGSNDMARYALSWIGTIDECISRYGAIPPGAWLFVHKTDGGEKARGYTDDKGNFSHVGVYLGNGKVIESTTGGVQIADLSSKWNRAGLAHVINYAASAPNVTDALNKLQQAISLLNTATAIIKEVKP